MKDVTLNQQEQARLSVLNSVLEYQVPIDQVAELLEVSQRHAHRMLAAYHEHGATALAPGNRGRPSPQRHPCDRGCRRGGTGDAALPGRQPHPLHRAAE